jgi:hypothetical protein
VGDEAGGPCGGREKARGRDGSAQRSARHARHDAAKPRENDLAKRTSLLTDDELTRIRTLGAYYAFSEEALGSTAWVAPERSPSPRLTCSSTPGVTCDGIARRPRSSLDAARSQLPKSAPEIDRCDPARQKSNGLLRTTDPSRSPQTAPTTKSSRLRRPSSALRLPLPATASRADAVSECPREHERRCRRAR